MSRLLSPLCPKCGTPLRPGVMICATCGDDTAAVSVPSASALLYLFADTIAPKPKPATLATLLFAASFWDLNEQGLIKLEYEVPPNAKTSFLPRWLQDGMISFLPLGLQTHLRRPSVWATK